MVPGHSCSSSKKCIDCGILKTIDEFARNSSSRDGYGRYCVSCHRERQIARHQWRAAKPVDARIDIPTGNKWCPGCSSVKPFKEWGRNRSGRDGYNSYCKSCSAERNARDYLKRKHGLTPEEVQELTAAQDGLCALCRVAPAAHVDHDHATGRRRGILCFTCNVALGLFKDDPEMMRRGIEYLAMFGAARRAESEQAEPPWGWDDFDIAEPAMPDLDFARFEPPDPLSFEFA